MMSTSSHLHHLPFTKTPSPSLPLPSTSLSISLSTRRRLPLPLSSGPTESAGPVTTNPALKHANILYFQSGYNVQIVVDEGESEEALLRRFRREVSKAGVMQECKRRKFFENKHEEKKRKQREAGRRNRWRYIASMDPGPVDPSVLYSQDKHRSRTCAEDLRTLDCIDHFLQVRSLRREDERVQAVLQRAGFIHFSRLDYVRLDRSLITALVERWRPETWSFHFRVGEMGITLQDVSIILGLRIDGPAVTRRLDILSWEILYQETLGRVPPDMRGVLNSHGFVRHLSLLQQMRRQ